MSGHFAAGRAFESDRGARALALLAAAVLVACTATCPARAQGLRLQAAEVRVSLTAAERRERIRTLLVSRGAVSPLLERARPVAVQPPAAPPELAEPAPPPFSADRQLDKLLELIAQAEAGPAGYDAIHHRAVVLPEKAPTLLTLGEIFDWIDRTPGQPHAIGRYQIIPSTLAYLTTAEGLALTDVFSPGLQDRLARRLVQDAGLDEFRAGLISGSDFMDSLALVWAGFPLSSGLSAYEGVAGNSATLTRQAFQEGFNAIFGATPVPVRVAVD